MLYLKISIAFAVFLAFVIALGILAFRYTSFEKPKNG